jgi:putative ABC transport system permease protein
LKKGADHKTVEQKFALMNTKYFPKSAAAGIKEVFYLQPLQKAYLYSDFEYEIGKAGNYRIVWSLLVIALFILVLAWMNYINLSTARSLERAKEVGIRKVLGVRPSSLMWQFLFESVLMSIATSLRLFLQITAEQFNQLVNRELSIGMLFKTNSRYGHYHPVCAVLACRYFPFRFLSCICPFRV